MKEVVTDATELQKWG